MIAFQNTTPNDVQKNAITDSLTGLYNQRGIIELGEYEVQRTLRYNRPLTAIMVNIDRFQEIAQSYGRVFGNHVVATVAQQIRNNIRKVDLVGRFSGDEFMVLLPESDLFGASVVAERLRSRIEHHTVSLHESTVQITISLGISKFYSGVSNLEGLMKRANEALLVAKSAGGNRAEIR